MTATTRTDTEHGRRRLRGAALFGVSPRPPSPLTGRDDLFERYRQQRIAHWNAVAKAGPSLAPLVSCYHSRLADIYRRYVAPGQRVIELGCGRGDLLASLGAARAVGVDFSAEMLREARQRHPGITFVESDVHDLDLQETFDVVILSDLVDDLFDVQAALSRLRPLCHPQTRIILNFHSRAWQLPLNWARRRGLANPVLEQNWLTTDDVSNLLALAGFEVVGRSSEILCPLRLPLVSWVCNRYLSKVWPFSLGDLANFVVARPHMSYDARVKNPRVSVIVPARNEEGNVPQIFERIPDLAGGTEIIFVEGGSSDNTYEAAQSAIQDCKDRACLLLKQTGKGKGDAVRLGFARATGDILAILDADLTVPPEDLPRFVEALRSGHGEFINGVRLVYPMQDQAMRFLNLLGNKFFSFAFSWLLGQPIKDTLCGTKVLWREDYERIAANRSYFGDFDPYGDFDLIFGAAKQHLKIVDVPIRYRARTYGETNINRWTGGWLLLRMVLFAARRLKFV